MTNDILETTDLSIINLLLMEEGAELTKEQLSAMGETLEKEKVIWSVEQGLGKTYLSVALANMTFPSARKLGKKILICVPSNKLADFENHLKSKTQMNITTTTGGEKEVNTLIKNFKTTDCILCTQSAWQKNLDFNCLMFNNADKIYTMIYDEASGVNDKGYTHFIELARRHATYVAMANATPIGSASSFNVGSKDSLQSLYNLLYAIDEVDIAYSTFYTRYTDDRGMLNGVVNRTINTTRIMDSFGFAFVNMNRTEVGAVTTFSPCIFHRVMPTPKQKAAIDGKELNSSSASKLQETITGYLYRPEICYNHNILPMEIGALSELYNLLLKSNKDDNIIVYAKNNDTIKYLQQLVTTAVGRKCVVLDGQTTNTSESKLEAESEFNNNPGSIIITNIEKGSNLGSANTVIVYDAPADVLQYIFRGIRGNASKNIRLEWIYYPNYEENSMLNCLEQMKKLMDMFKRENPLYNMLKQELFDVYPNNSRLKSIVST